MARRAGVAAPRPASTLDSSTVEASLPAAVLLLAPHGFIDDEGEHKHWPAGHTVTDQDTVALLIARGARLQHRG